MVNQTNHQQRDLDLIKRARAGDSLAYDQLLMLYKPLVRARANLYFLPGADIEDLIQEGMLGLFAAVQRYDESRGSFAGFADIAVVSHIKDAIRAANRQRNAPLNESLSLDDQTTPLVDLTLTDTIDEREQLDALREFMQNELSSYEQQVASLYVAGYAYKEIASKTSTTRKGVDNAMSRIRRKLKQRP